MKLLPSVNVSVTVGVREVECPIVYVAFVGELLLVVVRRCVKENVPEGTRTMVGELL